MLHEQVRTYKRDLHDSQASNTAHDRHIMRLQAEVKRMHEALKVSSMLLLCNAMAASPHFACPTSLVHIHTPQYCIS